ncbi:FAD/NAD(P)-binding domain-containing protein [Thozetella sp. PMI_491]|nr:FAD/NAD(P)-binding domain-containing protein [Thozetella sp. PMI_491]
MQNPKIRVAVVGAGFAGLAAVKQCLDADLEVEAFEALGHIGGQWAYQDCALDSDASAVWSSIYAGTLLNSCRDTTSFTDFPLDPARYGDYFNHRLYLRYLCEYASHFDLEKHVRLRTKVLRCVPHDDGKWTVRIQGPEGAPEEKTFDAVFACTGHLSTPVVPEFPGRDSFRGQSFHSHFYRTPGPFEGKRVAIIGLGSSAVDIACEIGPHAKEVSLVTRRGGWILPRYVLGKPLEAWDSRLTQVVIPPKISEWLQTKLLQLVDIEAPKELVPDHTVLSQSPTIRGDFLEKVASGIVNIKRASVDAVTETGLQLSTGEALEADVIIYATGYDYFDLPYLPDDAVRAKGSPAGAIDLYKLTMSPQYSNLFFLGYIETLGPFPPTVEGQARHATAVLEGRIKQPSKEEMWAQIKKWQAHQAKAVVDSERHRVLEHPLPYLDDLLAPLGIAPTFGRLLGKVFTSNPWEALGVLNAVYFGVPTSAQYRLFGHGKTEALARETVLRVAGGKKKLSDKEVKMLAEQRRPE